MTILLEQKPNDRTGVGLRQDAQNNVGRSTTSSHIGHPRPRTIRNYTTDRNRVPVPKLCPHDVFRIAGQKKWIMLTSELAVDPHADFAKVQVSRPDWRQKESWHFTKTVNPDWKLANDGGEPRRD